MAEGVETEDQAKLLRDSKVDFGQGFYFSPALELRALQSFVESRNNAAQLFT